MTEQQTPNGQTLAYRVGQLEITVRELERKVDRLIMAIVGASLSFTVGIGVFAITLLTQKGGP